MAIGNILPDGTYRLTTFREGDGASYGRHAVTITARRVADEAAQPKSFEEEIRMASKPSASRGSRPRITWLAPQKYSERDTTPLTAEVTAGKNVFDFVLED